MLLGSNRLTRVQSAEIRWDGGVFWGVQYHPEIRLLEVPLRCADTPEN